jgi:aspartyl-tRNA(Asn)/glutamyl-tRNA(Gln) amidotransferase subunit C
MDINEVHHIAKLSRLELSPAEAEAVLPQLTAIFALVGQMQAVDTSSVDPLPHPILFIRDLAQPLRPDTVTEHEARENNMAHAPAQDRGYFLVPRVIE